MFKKLSMSVLLCRYYIASWFLLKSKLSVCVIRHSNAIIYTRETHNEIYINIRDRFDMDATPMIMSYKKEDMTPLKMTKILKETLKKFLI